MSLLTDSVELRTKGEFDLQEQPHLTH